MKKFLILTVFLVITGCTSGITEPQVTEERYDVETKVMDVQYRYNGEWQTCKLYISNWYEESKRVPGKYVHRRSKQMQCGEISIPLEDYFE